MDTVTYNKGVHIIPIQYHRGAGARYKIKLTYQLLLTTLLQQGRVECSRHSNTMP